eukprot:scaffold26257_cov63-Phaeocystis_antarctica.AAC.6
MDEDERVGDEGSGSCRKRQGLAEQLRKDSRGGMVREGEGTGHADDVLRACTPPVLVHLASNELVDEAIVHLLCRVLDEVRESVGQHVRAERRCNGSRVSQCRNDRSDHAGHGTQICGSHDRRKDRHLELVIGLSVEGNDRCFWLRRHESSHSGPSTVLREAQRRCRGTGGEQED